MILPRRLRALDRLADGAIKRAAERLRERAVAAEHLLKIGAVPTADWRLQGPALRAVHRLQRAMWPARYTDANPYRRLWVDPAAVTHHVNRDPVPRVFGRVAGGDWDRRREPFAATAVHRSLRQRFAEGADWEETGLYTALLSGSESGLWRRRCRTEAERDRRLAAIDALYERIANKGYRSQATLARDGIAGIRDENNERSHPMLNEVGINIGRDGALLWRHRGLHRLSIAKLLGVERIPVYVLARHAGWQRVRDRLRAGESVGIDPASHPDLDDLRE